MTEQVMQVAADPFTLGNGPGRRTSACESFSAASQRSSATGSSGAQAPIARPSAQHGITLECKPRPGRTTASGAAAPGA